MIKKIFKNTMFAYEHNISKYLNEFFVKSKTALSNNWTKLVITIVIFLSSTGLIPNLTTKRFKKGSNSSPHEILISWTGHSSKYCLNRTIEKCVLYYFILNKFF